MSRKKDREKRKPGRSVKEKRRAKRDKLPLNQHNATDSGASV